MKRYREQPKGNDGISVRLSVLENHKQKIQKEILRLMEVQQIIEFKIDHYLEIAENPDFNDTGCTSTIEKDLKTV